VRCVDCQKETDSPRQHCECCGRDLVAASASTGSSQVAEARTHTARLCSVCGEPSPEGECCASCLRSFSAWAGTESAAASVAEPAAPSRPEKTDAIDSLWAELMNSPAPPTSEWGLESSPKPSAPAPPAPGTVAVAVAEAPVTTRASGHNQLQSPQAPPPIPAKEMPATIVAPPPAPPVAIHVEPIRIIEPVKSPVPVQRAEPKPTPFVAIPSRPRPKSKNALLLPSAAVVLVAAGLGAYWVQVQSRLSPEEERKAAVAVKEQVRKRQPAAPPAAPAAQERSAPPAAASTQARKQSAPRPAARPAQAATPKPRLVSNHSPEPILAASVIAPAMVTAPPEAAPLAASTAPSTAPQGPFFEPTDVHEPPRVASRVDPRVPEELRGRAGSEIVIVRMLVSQSGRPSRVSLLRKSKTGPRVDDAVISAVNQWTFSPAKRRGEAVSSWFNIGVPVAAN